MAIGLNTYLAALSYDFISVFCLFILINSWRGRSILKRFGRIGGIKDIFDSLSSFTFGNYQQGSVKYYCMNCGKEHNEIACPNCGSKIKRVG
jgi:hypothetical protein